MYKAAEQIINILSNDLDFNALVGDAIYWAIAPSKQLIPFCNFNVADSGNTVSKDLRTYEIELDIWAGDLSAGDAIYQTIINKIENQHNWRFISGRSQYADDQATTGFLQINFNIKI